MRRYETLFILDPDLSEEDRVALTGKYEGIIASQAGVLIQFDHWGQKRLAYEIRRKERGYYILMNYCGAGKIVAEIERLLRIDDRVLKYITVMLEKDVNVDALQASVADQAAAATSTSQAASLENESSDAAADRFEDDAGETDEDSDEDNTIETIDKHEER